MTDATATEAAYAAGVAAGRAQATREMVVRLNQMRVDLVAASLGGARLAGNSEGVGAVPAVDDLESRIAAEFRPGARAKNVAGALGVSRYLATQAMRRMGWPLKRGQTKGAHRSDKPDQIKALVRGDPSVSLQTVATHFGVTRQYVSRLLKCAEITKERAARVHAETAAKQAAHQSRVEAAAALRDQGLPVAQIATRIGVARTTAYRLCRDLAGR